MLAQRMLVAYFVSRFPALTETFILRELEAVDASPELSLELFALTAARKDGARHAEVAPWVERLHRLTPRSGLRAVGWWARRRPLALASGFAQVLRDYAANPRVLPRALASAALGCAGARAIASLGVDRVHAHWSTYPALAAWMSHRLTGIPYSFTAHAHDLFLTQAGLRTKVKSADFVVAISEFNRQFLGPFGADATPVKVVHCGIDPGQYEFRPRLLDADGPVRAVCVASLVPFKGHAVLLEALADPDPVLARLRLEFVGEGWLRAELESRVVALGLVERVRFVGARSQAQVAAILACSDVAVLASRWANGQTDGIPVALLEAMACGLPVVATRVSGIPELVQDGNTGVLAEPDDIESLRRALKRVLADPAGAQERARRGRSLVEREFAIEGSAARLVKLFTGRAL